MTADITTDYLVVGAGATAMAFVDTLLDETDATVTVVDRRAHPGGHWNDAYPFIGLHAPALFYGVPSMPLGRDEIETEGPNAGHRALATKPELLAYYDRVMRRRFLPSGRVTWLPKHEYAGGGAAGHRLLAIVGGGQRDVRVRRRLVDATWTDAQIPATHAPRYRRAPGVALVTPGDLERLGRAPERFCIVGAGKTAMDSGVWLLTHGVDPARIRWIKPRESWVYDRAATRDFDALAGALIGQLRAIAEASSLADFTGRLDALGMLRIDEGVAPTQFRGALLSRREVELLRTIADVVRLGRVDAIEPSRVVLENGVVPAAPDTVYVDCTAAGLNARPAAPMFAEGRIDLQHVRETEALFSASFVAFVEARLTCDAEKNAVCGPVPPPSTPGDLLRGLKLGLDNAAAWMERPEVMAWAGACRLGMLTALDSRRAQDPADPTMQAFAQAMAAAAPRLPSLIADADAAEDRALRGHGANRAAPASG